MTKIYLLQLTGYSIFEQLQIEEALLRADERNWCLINSGVSPAIVMGISGKQDLLIDKKRIQDKPIPIIRRFSGGGTVIVDENTYFITLICNEACTGISAYPQPVLQWNASLFQTGLQDHEFRALENDYVLKDKKFGGNAQYLTKKRWLHHSSILWDFQQEHMDYLLMPNRTPNYREKRSHYDFLCKLCHYLPTKKHLEEMVLKELRNRFEVIETPIDSIDEVLLRPHRKATEFLTLRQ